MEILNARQGSPEWAAHRASHFNASDAPAMMGVSKYKSRSQLLHEMATGIPEEHDDDTQKRFADGHAAEALARPLAEKIIGQDLYPVTGYDEEHSASFDGLTVGHDIASEHKSLNDEIRACKTAADLHPMYRIQMEQQLMVSGAGKCLFMASKWKGDELIEEKHFWYAPDLQLRSDIIAGWKQFAIDLANYTPPEVIPDAVAAPIKALPTLFIQARGEITKTNMPEFKEQVTEFLGTINMTPATDQEFADGKSIAKKLRELAVKMKERKADMLAQTETIGKVAEEIDLLSEVVNKNALALEKAVEREEYARKLKLIADGKALYSAHIDALKAETGGPWTVISEPDFAGAIKGKSKFDSMRNAIDTALANGKIAADASAKLIRERLSCLNTDGAGYEFLFADRLALITKPVDDLKLLIKSRIDAHKAAEQKKADDLREKIRKEEEAKAAQKAAEEQRARDIAMRAAPPAIANTVISNHEPVAIGSVLPPVQRITTPQVSNAIEVSGIKRLTLLIDEAMTDMSAGELQQLLDSARGIKAGRTKAAQG